MPKPKSKETHLLTMLNEHDPVAIRALELTMDHFADRDAVEKTHYFPVLRVVYLDRCDDYNWKIAINLNISDSTFYRCRRKIIAWFEYYCRKVSSQAA